MIEYNIHASVFSLCASNNLSKKGESTDENISDALCRILRTSISAKAYGAFVEGMHADEYWLRFSYDGVFPKQFLFKMNRFLPSNIRIHDLYRIKHCAPSLFNPIFTYNYAVQIVSSPFNRAICHEPFIHSQSLKGLQKKIDQLSIIFKNIDFYKDSHLEMSHTAHLLMFCFSGNYKPFIALAVFEYLLKDNNDALLNKLMDPMNSLNDSLQNGIPLKGLHLKKIDFAQGLEMDRVELE